MLDDLLDLFDRDDRKRSDAPKQRGVRGLLNRLGGDDDMRFLIEDKPFVKLGVKAGRRMPGINKLYRQHQIGVIAQIIPSHFSPVGPRRFGHFCISVPWKIHKIEFPIY